MLSTMTTNRDPAKHAAYMREWMSRQPPEWHERRRQYAKNRYATLDPAKKASEREAMTALRRVRRSSRGPLAATDVVQAFTYDPATGIVAGRDAPRKTRVERSGHVVVTFRDRNLFAHRIAWCIMTGDWPAGMIDHRNGDPADNRWENLRLATRAVNSRNLGGPYKNNKSGYLGVSPRANGWAATIMVDGKNRYLGTYPTPEKAYVVYLAAKAELHPECERLPR